MKDWLRLYPLWDKDEGSGANDDADETEDPSGEDDENSKKGQDDKAKGKKKEESKEPERPTFAELMEDPDFKQEAQKWVDEKTEWRIKKARQKEREEKLQKQEEYKTLADERATQIETLEQEKDDLTSAKGDLEKQLKETNAALQTYVETLKEGVDEAVLELLDAKSLPEQLTWLSKHTSQAETEDGDKKKRPVPPSPKPGDEGEAAKKQRGEKAQQAATRQYKSNF